MYLPARTAALALILAACGSSVEDDDDGGGGSGGSATSTGASTTTGTTGAGGGDLLCPEFGDQELDDVVTFRIRNDTGAPVYLPTECGLLEATLRMGPDDQRDDLSFPFGPDCSAHCEHYQTEEGPPSCAPCAQGTFELLPGEELAVPWTATALALVQMPGTCAASGVGPATPEDPYPGVECNRAEAPPEATYVLEHLVFGTCNECVCDPDGSCDGSPGNPIMTSSMAFDLPASEVLVVLPVCFFGCAGDP